MDCTYVCVLSVSASTKQYHDIGTVFYVYIYIYIICKCMYVDTYIL